MRVLMPAAVISGAFESAEQAQIAAPVPTCSSSFTCWEGRAEERGERAEPLWIKMRDMSGRAVQLNSYATKWIGGFSLMCATQSCRGTLTTSVPMVGVCGHLLDSLSAWDHSDTLLKPEQARFGRFYGIMFFWQDRPQTEGRCHADLRIKTWPDRHLAHVTPNTALSGTV